MKNNMACFLILLKLYKLNHIIQYIKVNEIKKCFY